MTPLMRNNRFTNTANDTANDLDIVQLMNNTEPTPHMFTQVQLATEPAH